MVRFIPIEHNLKKNRCVSRRPTGYQLHNEAHHSHAQRQTIRTIRCAFSGHHAIPPAACRPEPAPTNRHHRNAHRRIAGHGNTGGHVRLCFGHIHQRSGRLRASTYTHHGWRAADELCHQWLQGHAKSQHDFVVGFNGIDVAFGGPAASSSSSCTSS